MSESSIQQSPLAEMHHSLGAKMVPFAGWSMPVQYTSILDEHTTVRSKVGVFDISHMGQFLLTGAGAEAWLNSMLTNDVEKLEVGQSQYTIMLNPKGGVIDDLIIYRFAKNEIFMVVNASKVEEDYAWLNSHLIEGLSLSNVSASWAAMAVQGPESSAVFATLFPERLLPERNGCDYWQTDGVAFAVCRTGYTGEDGFELFTQAEVGSDWFKRCIEAGAKPCGLGARDSLRTEVCYPLNGAELSAERSPLQAGLGFFCALDTEFVGVDVLRKQKQEGMGERLVALEYTGKGAPPRAHYEVYDKEGGLLSELSSGILSPSLKLGVGMAYLPEKYIGLGSLVDIDVRGRRYEAKVVKKPFYKKG